jgi:hypothetical protein
MMTWLSFSFFAADSLFLSGRCQERLSQKFSSGKASLNLKGKTDFPPLFPGDSIISGGGWKITEM